MEPTPQFFIFANGEITKPEGAGAMQALFGKPLPRPHCDTCGVDMWLVESKPTKVGLVELVTFQCPTCNALATKLLDLSTDQETSPNELLAK